MVGAGEKRWKKLGHIGLIDASSHGIPCAGPGPALSHPTPETNPHCGVKFSALHEHLLEQAFLQTSRSLENAILGLQGVIYVCLVLVFVLQILMTSVWPVWRLRQATRTLAGMASRSLLREPTPPAASRGFGDPSTETERHRAAAEERLGFDPRSIYVRSISPSAAKQHTNMQTCLMLACNLRLGGQHAKSVPKVSPGL